MAKGTGADSIKQLFSRGQPMFFGKGDIILGNEPVPNGVYYITSGYVKVYTISDDGDEYLHIIYGHGEIFPVIWAYLGATPDGMFYQAISDTVLWRISREWFHKFASTDVELGYELSLQLARQFQVYSDRVDNLEYKKAIERVAYRLLFLAGRFGRRSGNEVTIDAPITHELFANSVNLARETVSRQLEILTQAHIIRSTGRHIVIQDVPALVGKLSRPTNIHNWDL